MKEPINKFKATSSPRHEAPTNKRGRVRVRVCRINDEGPKQGLAMNTNFTREWYIQAVLVSEVGDAPDQALFEGDVYCQS